MKKLLFAVTTLCAVVFGPSAHALEIQVAPLALDAKVEVLGIKAEVNGQGAIVLAGEAAKAVAYAAGYTLNTAAEMVILTGAEVDALLGTLAYGAVYAGKTILFTSEKILEFAMTVAVDAARAGHAVIKFGAKELNRTTRFVLKTLAHASRTAVLLVADTGIFVVETGADVVGAAIDTVCFFIPVCE